MGCHFRAASFAFACLSLDVAAWGADGHAIVAEIAQRRLSRQAFVQVERLLGRGTSLASISMWADDMRDARPETSAWHFVDIPLAEAAFDAGRDCPVTPKGDCIVGALARMRAQLACGRDAGERREALRFVVHLVADIHQPFHTVQEDRGANQVRVDLVLHPGKCPRCGMRRGRENLHSLWDSALIAATAPDWGAYVSRLEEGALSRLRDDGERRPAQWAAQAHEAARAMRRALRDDGVVDDAYYASALPVLDRQLALAGLRLASLLNEAFAGRCAR